MQAFKKFLKRNAPVFIFGLIIALVFLLIILTQPKDESRTPSGFRRVEEEIFEREPKEPEPAEKPTEYAPQIPSPENKGKPYFYGEYDPNLRDEEGYPKPPELGSTEIPGWATETDIQMIKIAEYEALQQRKEPVHIGFDTEKGFNPVNANAYTGGKVVWTNNTDREIEIQQSLPIHQSLKNGVVLKPGESYTFRPLVDGLFSYAEINTRIFGTIWVSDVTLPLVQNEE